MKYISFAVPCYNSEDYMEKCIESLLLGGKDVEIIIIDDGSTDSTGAIADSYEKKYPDIIKVVHQENGGHGAGIMRGIKEASGKYFKIVDSDDWVDESALKEILKRVKKINSDMVVMNYVYTHSDGRKDQAINFSNVFPNDKESTWDDMGRFGITQYLSLHSIMYKKSLLDKCKIDLPKHTFYEDNLFIYIPFPKVKSIYYLDVDFYMYYIGRPDQSVQDAQLIKRNSHQILVTKTACNLYNLDEIENQKLRKMMLRECSFLMSIAIVFSRMSYTDEGEKAYKELWQDIKKNNPNLYRKIRFMSMAMWVSVPTKLGRFLCIKGYRLAHKLVSFN